MPDKKVQIRNSTAEFLVFSAQANENTIEVMVQDETVWLTQKMIAALFEVEVNTINYHLKEIYKSAELQATATIRKFRIVQTEGKRDVSREVEFYNLDAIISIGYRVNSVRATQFRQWEKSHQCSISAPKKIYAHLPEVPYICRRLTFYTF